MDLFPQVDSTLAKDSTKKQDKYIRFYSNVDPLLEEETEEKKELETKAEKKRRKRRKKKKWFHGYKTKKGYAVRGQGKRQVVETFRYLKEYKQPNEYVKYYYIYDNKKLKIVRTTKVEPGNVRILHGPYEKRIGKDVVERGYYYVGTKHGRWEYLYSEKQHKFKYGTEEDTIIAYQSLKDKEVWDKGWPKSSDISYYDREKTKVKEVMPYENNEKHGEYFLFHENGQVAVHGKYEFGHKVGKWYEYYPGTHQHKRKKIIQYPDDPFDESEAIVLQEYNKEGEKVGGESPKKEEPHGMDRYLKRRRP